MERLDKVDQLTASGYYSLNDNTADSIIWKRTMTDKIKNEALEMPNISEIKQKPSQEASTIHVDEEKVRHTSRDFDTVEPGNSKIEISNRDNAIERGKDDNKNGLKAPEKGIIASEVNDTRL